MSKEGIEQTTSETIHPGSWAYLKLMMEASAWDGVIQLDDALRNINDFVAFQPAGGEDEAVLVPRNATEQMQRAMQRAVLLRKSMNDVWRAALSESGLLSGHGEAVINGGQ